MGTKITCIQVHLGDNSRADIRTRVLETVRQRVLAGPFVETTREDDQDPDREVFIGPIGDAPWLTVYDSQGDLRELAQRISVAIGGTAIFINLIDSSVIHLRRYSKGDMMDDFCNYPELYNSYSFGSDRLANWPELDEEQVKTLTRGDPLKWRDLMVAHVDPAELRTSWDSKPVFADDILVATADALGMNKEEVWSDYYVEKAFTRLTFRLTEPRQYEIKAEGPPKLELAASSHPYRLYVGDELDIFNSIRNDGGAATGLDIIVWGSAVESGMVKLARVGIRKTAHLEDTEETSFQPREEKIEAKRVTLYRASYPAFELPQGIADALEVGSQPGVNWWKAWDALSQAEFHVRVLGRVEAVGRGELFIAYVPHSNREDGRAIYENSLEVLPRPSRRPLRSKEAELPISSHEFHTLEDPAHLFALVSLGTDREQSGKIVFETIEAWVAQVADSSTDVFVAHVQINPSLMLDKVQLSAAEIPESGRWSELRSALKQCLKFSIKHRAAGIAFDVTPLSSASSVEEVVPHLLFWYETDALDEAALKATQTWLVDRVNDLMTQAVGLQAIMGCWNWRWTWHLDRTPYEDASGVHGSFPTAHFWCQRFLRGVTEQLWLGPDLLAHLDNMEQLTSVAEVTPVGDGVHVILKEGATLDDLEEAVAPLLPSEKDWHEGYERLWPRHRD